MFIRENLQDLGHAVGHPFHEVINPFLELVRRRRSAASYIRLDGPIDILIRIQFGAVRRQEKELDPEFPAVFTLT